MRLFVAIADRGSLSAAARQLGLSQPSVSRQLKQLETLLEAQLVWRTSSEFALTDAGENFLVRARGMLEDWDAITDTMAAHNQDLHGPIRIAAPVASGQTVLAQIAIDFMLRHPGVTIDLHLTEDPGDLAAGNYDVWIKAGAIQDTSLIVRKLLHGDRAIVGRARQQPVAHPRELEHRNAVLLLNYVTRELPLANGQGQTFKLRMTVSFSTDNTFAALLAVKEGVGFGVLPLWLTERFLAAGILVDLCPGWHPPPVILSLAYPQSRFRPVRVKTFIDFVQAEFLRAETTVLDGVGH